MEIRGGRTEVCLLLVILALAAALRLIGLDHGLPYPLIAGEITAIDDVPGMTAGVDRVATMLLIGRLLSVVVAVAAVWLVWRLARDLFTSPAAALTAAVLLATSWYAVVFAHTALGWSAASFAIWLTVWWAHAMRQRPDFIRGLVLTVATGLVIAVAVFWLGPSLNPPDTGSSVETTAAEFYALHLWWADPVLTIAGVLGLALMAMRRTATMGLLAVAIVLCLVLMDQLASHQEGALVLILPGLALGAGGGVAQVGAWAATRAKTRVVAAGLGGLILVFPLATAAWIAWLMVQDDTRFQARNWLAAHAPAGLPVVVDMAPVTLATNQQGLADQEAFSPGDHGSDMSSGANGPTYQTVHINDMPQGRVDGEAGFALFDQLVRRGYLTYLVAVRPDRQATGFQVAALESTERLAEFLPSFDYRAPLAPDLSNGRFATAPVWRFFVLDRLGPPTTVGYALYGSGP